MPQFATVQDILENEPTTVTEAQGRPDWPKWKEAMDAEIAQLKTSEHTDSQIAQQIRLPFQTNGFFISNVINMVKSYGTRHAL